MRKTILIIGTALALTALVFAGGNYCSPEDCGNAAACAQCCPCDPACCR